MKYDFVPAEISIGRFNMTNAFVSCKYNYDKWQNVSVFERLCGFKPYEQRDSEKQLKKAIYNAVDTIENCVATGFKLIGHDKDMYKLSKKVYTNDANDVIIQDPRGFAVAVTKDNFYYMLDSCNGSMKDYVLDHKFAYAWSKDCTRFMIVDAETEEFAKCKSESDKLKDKSENGLYVLPRNLKVGHAYAGSDRFKGKYIYLGKMDICDKDYHLDALKNKSYRQMSEFKNDDSSDHTYGSVTAEQKHVFYRIGPKEKFDMTSHPFIFRSSMSKIFEREIDISGIESKMFNDLSKTVTYENVREYMSTCFLFNKIDMKTLSSKDAAKICDFSLFSKILKHMTTRRNNDIDSDISSFAYPSAYYDLKDSFFLVKGNCRTHMNKYYKAFNPFYDEVGVGPSYKGTYVQINGWNDNNGTCTFHIKQASSRRQLSYAITDELHKMSIKDLYDYLEPSVLTAKYENGKSVKELDMLLFQGRDE